MRPDDTIGLALSPDASPEARRLFEALRDVEAARVELERSPDDQFLLGRHAAVVAAFDALSLRLLSGGAQPADA